MFELLLIKRVLLIDNARSFEMCTMSTDLTYSAHTNIIVAKALQQSSSVYLSFVSYNLQLVREAFITYDRPMLE